MGTQFVVSLGGVIISVAALLVVIGRALYRRFTGKPVSMTLTSVLCVIFVASGALAGFKFAESSYRLAKCGARKAVDTGQKLLTAAEKLQASGGNEANTKALLIEPLLAALDWDTADLDQVEREHRVLDGTAVDYALKIEGDPRLFVEAKVDKKSIGMDSFQPWRTD